MSKLSYIGIVFMGALAIFSSSSVYAASVALDSSASSTEVGGVLRVKVALDPEQQNINATEGRVVFPSDLFRLVRVETGGSMVSAWIVSPRLSGGDTVEWGGIFSGGFLGVQDPYRTGLLPGGLFTLVFEAVQRGLGTIRTEATKVFLNDGKGTAISFGPRIISVRVDSPSYTLVLPTESIPPDKNPPESFIPKISRDETVAEGKWFVVFQTHDKESGVASYAIAESPRRMQGIGEKVWNQATSPVILLDQTLKSYIYVRAVDFAGDERVVELQPRNGEAEKVSSLWALGTSIFLLITVGLWGLRRFYRAQKRG